MRAQRAPVASLAMETGFMCAKLDSRIEALLALKPGVWVGMCTSESFQLKVINIDMSLQCRVFPESLVARRIPVTAELLSAFVCLFMSSKSCGCQERLSAVLPVADVVSLFRMSTLCVMSKVRLSQEGFVTI